MSRKKSKAAKPVAPNLTRRQIWCFRLFTLFGVPLIILLALELGLRLAGFGYPTSFLLPSENHGLKTYVQNDQFGWRFFGANMSRLPEPISITRQKPPGNVRILYSVSPPLLAILNLVTDSHECFRPCWNSVIPA